MPEYLDGLVQYLGDLEGNLANCRPLALAIKATVEQDNRDARLAGVDRFDRTLDPVKSQRGRSGSGPPLAPRGAASRVIAGYQVQVYEIAPGTYRVTGSWPGLPWLYAHTEGKGRYGPIPVRDIEGIRPAAWTRISEQVRDFAREAIRYRG